MAMAPVKVVLKSTTTQTLNDRFTEMLRHKGSNKQNSREEKASDHRASAKNRRLAEQMSRRPGIQEIASTPKMDKETKNNKGNVKNRIDRSRIKSNVKDRLGSTRGRGGAGSVQSRLGTVRDSSRGRGRGRVASNRGGRGQQDSSRGRGGSRGGRGTSQGSFQEGRSASRGRIGGRGRGGRSRGRGRGRGGGRADANKLNSELDNYMSANNS